VFCDGKEAEACVQEGDGQENGLKVELFGIGSSLEPADSLSPNLGGRWPVFV
jgi:hypothetical protein